MYSVETILGMDWHGYWAALAPGQAGAAGGGAAAGAAAELAGAGDSDGRGSAAGLAAPADARGAAAGPATTAGCSKWHWTGNGTSTHCRRCMGRFTSEYRSWPLGTAMLARKLVELLGNVLLVRQRG